MDWTRSIPDASSGGGGVAIVRARDVLELGAIHDGYVFVRVMLRF